MRSTRTVSWIAVTLAMGLCTGCATHTGTGALAGGGLGAATGAILGSAVGDPGAGAVIGAGVGAASGGLIGNALDENDRRNQARIAQASHVVPANAMSVADVVHMTRSGVSENTIVSSIRSSRSTFNLTPRDVVDLHHQGVSERVIQVMLDSSKQPPVVVREQSPVVVYEPYRPPVSIGFGYHYCRPRRWHHHHHHCW